MRMNLHTGALLLATMTAFGPALFAQNASQPGVTYERLRNASREPQNWMMYSGGYFSQRYSLLNQVTPQNVKNLELKWVYQADSLQKFEATPLVVDGVMYVTQAPNDVVALDAKTGRVFWIYSYKPAPAYKVCCGSVNRGLAILGDTLFMGTVDAHIVAIDARSGKPLWDTPAADFDSGYSITLAPLVVKDKVIIGVAGGEYGIRGFIAAYDVKTGKQAWKFYTIPGKGEPGNETWDKDSWEHGGASVWVTGAYDPELNMTYWGIGNPGPDWNPSQRQGKNLYSDSVVALDPDTGKLKWYFQFTPNDPYDYDSVQVPVLVDAMWDGRPRKLMAWANRNGFMYALDRTDGKFLQGKAFVKVNWASGLDDSGRPVMTPQPEGTPIFPGVQGGTNWYSPSYSPRTNMFYVSAWENYASIFNREEVEYKPGQRFTGGRPMAQFPGTQNPGLNPSLLNNYTEAAGKGTVMALDLRTGQKKWVFEMTQVTDAGVMTTASDLLFSGGREGYFFALDARDGKLLWRTSVGGAVAAGPMTYQVDGKQYIGIAAGHAMFVYGLRE
jgi:alcohol dehydrogenase (cytochrome c)